MHISRPPTLEELVTRKVESGLYNNASEALRLLDEYDRARALRLGELRQEVTKDPESGDPRPLDIEAIKREERARLTKRTQETS